jgi:hypothetical protein
METPHAFDGPQARIIFLAGPPRMMQVDLGDFPGPGKVPDDRGELSGIHGLKLAH